jgi:hypothetical protein
MSKYKYSYHPLKSRINGTPDEWQVREGKRHLFTIYRVDLEENSLFRVYTEPQGGLVKECKSLAEAKRLCEGAVCDHQWKIRFSEKRGSWRLCAKCSKEG